MRYRWIEAKRCKHFLRRRFDNNTLNSCGCDARCGMVGLHQFLKLPHQRVTCHMLFCHRHTFDGNYFPSRRLRETVIAKQRVQGRAGENKALGIRFPFHSDVAKFDSQSERIIG